MTPEPELSEDELDRVVPLPGGEDAQLHGSGVGEDGRGG